MKNKKTVSELNFKCNIKLSLWSAIKMRIAGVVTNGKIALPDETNITITKRMLDLAEKIADRKYGECQDCKRKDDAIGELKREYSELNSRYKRDVRKLSIIEI